MEKVSKNICKGGRIDDLNELVKLAKARKSVVVISGCGTYVRPAAFMIHWPLAMILRHSIYYAIRDSDIIDVEFQS